MSTPQRKTVKLRIINQKPQKDQKDQKHKEDPDQEDNEQEEVQLASKLQRKIKTK